MTEPDEREHAAAYALGLLSGETYARAAARVGQDDAFAAEAAATEEMLVGLALRLAPIAPSDRLLDRIEVEIAAGRPGASARVSRASDAGWAEVAEGVRIKILHQRHDERRQTYLLHMAPGATAPSHDHPQDEECFVISGDIAFGDVELGPGDYYVALPGWLHGAVRSRGGCTCLIVAGID